MGTSASVPLDIEAFRPQPPPDQPAKSHSYSAAVGTPANIVASPALAAETNGASTPASAAAATAAAVAVADLSSSLAVGGGSGEGNAAHRQGVAGGLDPFGAGGEGAPSTAECVVAATNSTVTGKRSRAATAVGDDNNSNGQVEGPPEKRMAWQPQSDGKVGGATSGLPEPGTSDTAVEFDVGNSPAPNNSGGRPDAPGVFTAAFNAINGLPTTAAARNGALAAPAGIVTNPVATSVDPSEHGSAAGTHQPILQPPSTTEALVVAPTRPEIASSERPPPPTQLLGVSPIDVGVESRESGQSAPPPPPVLSPLPQPMRAIVNGAATGGIAQLPNGHFHQAPSLTQDAHAVSPRPAAAPAFGTAFDPRAAPAGGVASQVGAGGELVSFAAAGAVAAPRHHYPSLVPPMPAGAAGGGGVGTAGGGDAPRPKKKRSGPAAGKRQERRKCGREGCKLRPTFGAEGTRLAQFCKSHKPEGFVNVLCKRCDVDGCKHQPSFGMPGCKPVRCATHRSDGMLNLAAPKCVSPGCRVVPSFAKPSARRASACSAHRGPGDVDIVTRRCHHEGCGHRPVFGDISVGKALYCSAHKLDGRMRVRDFVLVSWCLDSCVCVVRLLGFWCAASRTVRLIV